MRVWESRNHFGIFSPGAGQGALPRSIVWCTGSQKIESISYRLGITTDPPLDCPLIGDLHLLLRVVLWSLSGYITGYKMAETAQIRAIKKYRKRLAENGIARFEV